ncbi:iron complex transport system ATP-binding protein [Shewanella morhuae]|uniref:ABC transporter ATP-binding protein n=1 Tax=Shewanella morhuae TaxID=365591 RepID=UPI000954C7AD|nr:ABC transporter ATP-binding protein [Shewanella morhuae]SIQ76721.1 iron complex transport system ATP-binding protein [Shewanella morhuae]
MTIVNFNHADIGYNRHPVLRDVSFTVKTGEVCCLLGTNGCGKTTIIRSLLGILPLKGGSIQLHDKALHLWNTTELAQTVAYVPQAHDGPFAFSVLDMVMMGRCTHLKLFSQPGVKDRALAMELLLMLDIAHLAKRQYPSLSGGERQLVLIARALIQQPTLLIMDEPAASLDFGHQITLLERIRTLKKEGMTVLMSTHHPMHAKAVADKVVLVAKDQPIQQGSINDMLSAKRLTTLYGVQESDIRNHLGLDI